MSSEPKKLCIIHSLADSQQVGELVKRLRPLTDRTALELWHLGAVSAGTDLQEQLTAFLPQAIGVVIWISPDLWESPLYSLLRQNTTLLSPQTIVVPVLARHDSS
ncbi:MAG: hypothetical protein ABIQ93_05850, partial [Saprospiraceae bacterium]